MRRCHIPEQSVDTYAIEVTTARARLNGRSTWSSCSRHVPFLTHTTANSEIGSLSHVHPELIEEEPAASNTESRARAKKHGSEQLSGSKPCQPHLQPNPGCSHFATIKTTVRRKDGRLETSMARISSSTDSLERGCSTHITGEVGESSTTPARESKTKQYHDVNNDRSSSNTTDNGDATDEPVSCDYHGCKSPVKSIHT